MKRKTKCSKKNLLLQADFSNSIFITKEESPLKKRGYRKIYEKK